MLTKEQVTKEISIRQLRIVFPNLSLESDAKNWEITSPKTEEYNCIAWAAGETESVWWPAHNYYWPPSVKRQETIKCFVDAFTTIGYSISNSPDFEEGIEKVAFYVDDNGAPTHAARQLPNGHWTSKIGGSHDIEHFTLSTIEGIQYGSVSVIMERPSPPQAIQS